MKATLPFALALLASTATSSVVFDLSTEPGGKGTYKSWVVNRWMCHDLASDKPSIDNEASYAFVNVGLANACVLYEYVWGMT
jgi:hypothetical protein